MYNRIAKVFLVCVAATLISTSCSEENSSDERIVDGQIINVASAPYIVRLINMKSEHLCGGTIVAAQYVVTAAHCLDFVDPIRDMLVVAGVSTLLESGQVRFIINFDKPAAYNRATFNMDYAVLKLNTPLILTDSTQPIALCSKTLSAGNFGQISGFGRQVGGGSVSHNLRTIAMPLITDALCSTYYTLTNTMFCAAVANQGPCQYDSGGPLVVGGELCGIVSFGRSDCDYSRAVPAVFTSINAVLPFINNAIQLL